MNTCTYIDMCVYVYASWHWPSCPRSRSDKTPLLRTPLVLTRRASMTTHTCTCTCKTHEAHCLLTHVHVHVSGRRVTAQAQLQLMHNDRCLSIILLVHYLHHAEERGAEGAEELGAPLVENVRAQHGINGREDQENDEGIRHRHDARQQGRDDAVGGPQPPEYSDNAHNVCVGVCIYLGVYVFV